MKNIFNRKKDKRFGKADLVYVIILAFMLIGWKLIQNRKTESPVVSGPAKEQISQSQQPSNSIELTESKIETKIIAGYLIIGEWGIKIKMTDADKVTYDYIKYSYAQYGQEASSVKIKIKDEFMQDKTCDFSVEWVRYQKLDDYFKDVAVKIGDYYYVSGNNPYNCTDSEDSLLHQSLLKEFSNIQSL